MTGIPREELKLRGIYRIRSRNLLSGAWDGRAFIGIREKFGSEYLFGEFFCDGSPYGTATPIKFIEMATPTMSVMEEEEDKDGQTELFDRLKVLDLAIEDEIEEEREVRLAEWNRKNDLDMKKRKLVTVEEDFVLTCESRGIDASLASQLDAHAPRFKKGDKMYYVKDSAIYEGMDRIWDMMKMDMLPHGLEHPVLPGKLKYVE